MSKHGKKFIEAQKLVEKELYGVDEAVALLKKTTTTKFDSSCEVHIRLGVDPKQADQNIRTTCPLPHGTGKKVKIVAFVGEENIAAAKAAGAAEAGTDDLIKKIEKGWTDFDVALATPDQMKELSKIAKILGQKRLMPSPKSGTVTPEFEKAIQELTKGKVEIRVDKEGNTHNIFGKVSFEEGALKENLLRIVKTIMEVKPTTSKGTYLKKISLATSMGPGINVDTTDALTLSR